MMGCAEMTLRNPEAGSVRAMCNVYSILIRGWRPGPTSVYCSGKGEESEFNRQDNEFGCEKKSNNERFKALKQGPLKSKERGANKREPPRDAESQVHGGLRNSAETLKFLAS